MTSELSSTQPDVGVDFARTALAGVNRSSFGKRSEQKSSSVIHGLTAPVFVPPACPCGPDERRAIFERAGIGRAHWAELERIILEAPSRAVGKGALDNVVGGLFSRKCLNVVSFESHTVERALLYRLELDPAVIAYRTQVRLPNANGTGSDGKRYVNSIVTDLMVLRETSVTIVECKSSSWLAKEVKKPKTRWSSTDGEWSSAQHAAWAAARGLRFEVFAQSDHFAVELQNLEFLYAISNEDPTTRERAIIHRAKNLLASGPKTVAEICADVPGFNNRHTGQMLSRGLAFGMLRSQSIGLEDHFLVFDDERHARVADEICFTDSANKLGAVDISRPILTATATDVQIARSRLAKIEAKQNGQDKVSERTVRLERELAKGIALGLSATEALLGKTHKCGNRNARLDSALPEIISTTVQSFWVTGVITDLDDLHVKLKQACDVKGVTPCSKTTLRLAANLASTTRRALAIGGMRAYQASKPITPPDRRSLPPIAYGHTLHIDSSSLDNRSAPNLMTHFPAEKARFYIGVDGATANPMAHALIFGPARTDGLAILMREYVTRNGFLPAFIFIDRGSENTSRWFRDFCEEAGISWMYSPTGGSRYNGLAENVVGRVNSQVAHKLAGSTKPDQIGRAVDGKFKSRKNARIMFSVIAKEFETFIYNDLADNPNDDNISPRELSFEMLAFGEFCGRPACLDASLLIMTAVPTGTTPRIERGYVRTSSGKFSSIEFQSACTNITRVDELRRDCVNPSVMYARVGTSWHQVFNRAVHLYGQVADLEKLWMLLMQPINAAQSRERKLNAKETRYKRHKELNDAASAHESVSPPVNQSTDTDGIEKPSEPLTWEALNEFV